MDRESICKVIQKYKYRTPRFVIDIPVQMTLRNSTIAGRCIDISEEGMRVECPRPDLLYSHGTVTMTHPAWTQELNMRVAYTNSTHAGLVFVYRSQRERTMVAQVVASLGHMVCRRTLREV